jgi:hypothetical protein
MNETLKKRIAALERRTSDAGKLDAIKACLTGLFGEYGGGDTPEDFVAQISEETIKAAGKIGEVFIALFGLVKCEDGYYRERRKQEQDS